MDSMTTFIPIGQIHVDKDWNARKSYQGIPELAADIEQKGQITPVIVIPNGAAKGKQYTLIIGFRRLMALRKNKAKEVLATLREVKDEKEAVILNLTENLARDELTTYELALACQRLKDIHKVSDAKISEMLAAKKGLNRSYITNLRGALEKCIPKVLEAWADPSNRMHGVCTTDQLNALKSKTPEEQTEKWEELGGKVDKAGKVAREKGADDRGAPRRATGKALEAALEGLGGLEQIPSVLGAIATLKFALGKAQTISVSGETLYKPEAKKAKAKGKAKKKVAKKKVAKKTVAKKK